MKSLLIVLLLFMAGCSAAPVRPAAVKPGDYTSVKEYLDKIIPDEMARRNIKGLSVALVDGQDIVWMKGFGMADANKKIPVTEDTLFRIGSITKVFTALEIMKLVQENKIRLDDSIEACIPGFFIQSRFTNTWPITVRSLLAHHSGLPDNVLNDMWVNDPVNLEVFTRQLAGQYLVAPPQTMYRYSNVDYSLLGRIIELKTKQSYQDAMNTGILDELGMTSSTFSLNSDVRARLAKGYNGGNETAEIGLRDTPSGSMISNAADMAKYMKFVFNGGKTGFKQVIKPKLLDSMFVNQYEGLPLDFGQKTGMGLMLGGIDIPGAISEAWHYGGYPQYFCSLFMLDKQKLGIVILTNSDEAKSLMEKLNVQAMELMLEAKFGIKNQVDSYGVYADPHMFAVSVNTLYSYTGTYSAFGGVTKVGKNMDMLTINIFNNTFDLVPVSASKFVPKIDIFYFFPQYLSNLRVDFSDIGGTKVAVLRGLPAPFIFKKLEAEPVPDAWKDAEGAYKCENADDGMVFNSIVLTEEGGFPVVKENISNHIFKVDNAEPTVPLKLLSDSEAIVDGFGYSDGGTIRLQKMNGDTNLFYSGYIFTKLKTVIVSEPEKQEGQK